VYSQCILYNMLSKMHCYTGKVVIVFLAPSSVIKPVLELEAREPLHIHIP